MAHDVSGSADSAKTIDVWNEQKSNFLLSGQDFFTESMLNLHGRTIKACSFDFAPFSTSKPAKPGEKAIYDGIELKTFYEVADIMNFKYEVNEPQTGVKWAGIMSDVIKGVADMGTGHLFLTRGRALVADPTPAINVDYFCFLVPQAKAEARWKALYRPLETDTWLGLAVTMLLCVLFALLYSWLHPCPELKFDKLVFYMVGTFIDNSHEEIFHIK